MLSSMKKKSIQELIEKRNFAYSVVLFLMIVILILFGFLAVKQEKIIVVPSLNEAEKSYVLDGGGYCDRYYIDWASGLLGDLFTVNPHNVQSKNKAFLRWALSTSGLQETLVKSAKKLQREQISTAFYPETFKINRDAREIEISGRFLSYFGRSQEAVETMKSFVVTWRKVSGGALAIESLKEIKDE